MDDPYHVENIDRLSVLMFQTSDNSQLKSDLLKSIQISIKFFFNKKFKNGFYFFTCILPDYVAHDISKEFWENSPFKKMTAGFLLRCQNLLRWNTPEMMHFEA